MPSVIVGDIVGLVYAFDNHRSKDIPYGWYHLRQFTPDTR